MAKKRALKLLHTADWHLGKRLGHLSRLDEQRSVLDEICEIAEAEAVDAVLIAGDVFDTAVPPHEAEELFYRTVARLARGGERAVIAIAGNHDSPGKIENPDPLARATGIILAGYPDTHIHPFALENGMSVTRAEAGFAELRLPGITFPLRLLLTPYASTVRFKTALEADAAEQTLGEILQRRWAELTARYCNTDGVNLLMAHLFVMRRGEPAPEEPEEEKSILHVGGAEAVYSDQIPQELQYVALGHLHRRQTIAESPCPQVYSSSPLAYSMSEADQDKFVVLVEAAPGKPVRARDIPLKSGRRLLRATFDGVAEALRWLEAHPDAIVEITVNTDTYLTAEENRRLHRAHPAILAVVPRINNPENPEGNGRTVDLNRSAEELFIDYFRHSHGGAEPNDEILQLFREALALKDSG